MQPSALFCRARASPCWDRPSRTWPTTCTRTSPTSTTSSWAARWATWAAPCSAGSSSTTSTRTSCSVSAARGAAAGSEGNGAPLGSAVPCGWRTGGGSAARAPWAALLCNPTGHTLAAHGPVLWGFRKYADEAGGTGLASYLHGCVGEAVSDCCLR